jgi:PilZ domain
MKPARTRRTLPWIHHRPTRHLARLSCQVVRERDFRLIADRIVDLSSSGLRVGPADPVLTGERLLISFQLPWGRDWLDAEVRVARVIHGRRPFEPTRALGLEFESILNGERSRLGDVIAGLPLAPPQWRPGRRGSRTDIGWLVRASGRPAWRQFAL